jgi:hypothetical protein
MITPLVNRSDGFGGATLAARLVTGPRREGERATPPLDGSQYVSNGGIPNYGTAGLSGCRFAADPAHPIRHQFRTSAEARE